MRDNEVLIERQGKVYTVYNFMPHGENARSFFTDLTGEGDCSAAIEGYRKKYI